MQKVLFTATVDSHIQQFHIPYLKLFKEQGYEVHVATNGEEIIPYCDKKHKIYFERSPFRLNNLKALNQLKKIINNEQFDIIHCNTPVGGVITRMASLKTRKKNNTKVIYTAHGFHFFKGAPFFNWIIYYPIEKILAKYTDCLITINKEDYEFAKKHFKVKQIELVDGVGVDAKKFDIKMTKEEKIKKRKQEGLTEKDFVIIYVAELSKRKNQVMLLKAIAMLEKEGYENIKVLLAGSDSLNGQLQEMAKNLNIKNKIKFLGYRKDIPQLMKISDLAVSTSKQEGLPVNLIEAMMSGLPIIATNCRGNRDIVNNTVQIDNVVELCNNIKKCIKDKKKYIYPKCHNYEIENVLKSMKKIYNNIHEEQINV